MKYIAYLLVLVTLGIYSCDPLPDCSEVDTLTVFDDLRNVDSIVYMSDRLITFSPIFDSIESEMKFFINSDAEYDALKQLGTDANCTECLFPNIDFTSKTLIGYYLEIGCAQEPLQRFVTTSDSTFAFYSKMFNYNQCAFFTCPNETFNWMLVPKIDNINKVEFYAGEFYYDCDC